LKNKYTQHTEASVTSQLGGKTNCTAIRTKEQVCFSYSDSQRAISNTVTACI